jgi:hypothetical protein
MEIGSSTLHTHEQRQAMMSNRFELFCNYPALLHSCYYTLALHLDTLEAQAKRSKWPEFVWHKGESIRQLNKMLQSLSPEAVEAAIATIMYLDYAEPLEHLTDEDNAREFDVLPQSSEWMGARWMYTLPVGPHGDGMARIVKLAGGVTQLKAPGLAANVARYVVNHCTEQFRKSC